MSKFWLLGVIFLLSSTGWGVTYQVVVPGKAVLAQGRQEVDLKKHSVGAVTHHLLSYHAKKGDFTYEGVPEGVHSIAGLGSQTKILSDEEMLTYGWCFQLNGKTLKTLPHQSRFVSQEDRLVWFYAYAHYKRGKWLGGCIPANQAPGSF